MSNRNRIQVVITDQKNKRERDVLNLVTNLDVSDVTDAVLNSVDHGRTDLEDRLANLNLTFLVQVDSSFIESVSYNFKTQELSVTLDHGGVYDYDNVPSSVFLEFLEAPSQGVFFNQNLRNRRR